MLRLVAARDLCAIFRWSPAASRLAKGQVQCLNSLALSRIQKVNFFTTSLCRRCAPLQNPSAPDDPDTIDLDKWKTVMRLKSASEENVNVSDDEEENEETPDDNSLEATRDLVAMWNKVGKKVPEEISDEQLQEIAQLTTRSAKKKYLRSLWIKEHLKKKDTIKKQKKAAERKDSSEVEGDEPKELRNTFMVMFRNQSLDRVCNWKTAQAMRFGLQLVFDLSYEANLSKYEMNCVVEQLILAEAFNRKARDPFHLHFCNLQPDSYYQQRLLYRYGAETWDKMLLTSTEKQHFEVFPREQLVYLSADSPNVLHKFDPNKVYIIGGMVDKQIQTGGSMAKAKRYKLATARLPLDDFLHWEIGAKTLTLDQMMRIMISIKQTGKWKEALKFVPTRKHAGFHKKLHRKWSEDE